MQHDQRPTATKLHICSCGNSHEDQAQTAMTKRDFELVIAFVALAWIINTSLSWAMKSTHGDTMPGYVYADYAVSDGRIVKGVPQRDMTDCNATATLSLDPTYYVFVTAPYSIPESGVSNGERLLIVGVNCWIAESPRDAIRQKNKAGST